MQQRTGSPASNPRAPLVNKRCGSQMSPLRWQIIWIVLPNLSLNSYLSTWTPLIFLSAYHEEPQSRLKKKWWTTTPAASSPPPRLDFLVDGGILLPLMIGLKVPSYYVLVEQQSNTLPSVCVSVNHICSPTLLFQMASIIALFLVQMFYCAVPQHNQPWVDKALERLMGK